MLSADGKFKPSTNPKVIGESPHKYVLNIVAKVTKTHQTIHTLTLA